jgi:plasmid stabilization system protein ParE
MVEKVYAIVWDVKALMQFNEAYQYIRKDSYQNAQKVKHGIVETVKGLAKDPRRYQPDKFRLDKNPDFRSFELYRIRVTYYIDEDRTTVKILRVRSTWQEPFEH